MFSDSKFSLGHIIWLSAAVFISYLTVAMSLPVLSIFVTHNLGYNNTAGGLAVGAVFITTIFSRGIVGRAADTKGGKVTAKQGLVIYSIASGICLLSTTTILSHKAAYTLLLSGRLMLGIGESLTLVGIMTWGLSKVGNDADKFLAILGAGMYGSFALGSPIGINIYNRWGFSAVAAACVFAPLVGLLLILPIQPDKPARKRVEDNLIKIVKKVWNNGMVVGLQGVGFATIGAFQALLFKNNGWNHAGSGLACFSVGFVLMRIIGPIILRILGSKQLVAISLAIECLGQCLLWQASKPTTAILGAFLTGIGCSMIYPTMGANMVQKIQPQQRGVAMGIFSAFQDIAYAMTGPLAGLAVDRYNDHVAFFLGFCAAIVGFFFLLKTTMNRPLPKEINL